MDKHPGCSQDAVGCFIEPLAVPTPQLHELVSKFAETFQHLALTSLDQFLPTPVVSLPSGLERGNFLAIDLGGTNLRAGFIELLGEPRDLDLHAYAGPQAGAPAERPRIRRTFERAWPIGEPLKKDKSEDLFLWIGDCIAEVVADGVSALARDTANAGDALAAACPQEIPMGITFSFPMIQNSLAEATLMPMGKGFAITPNLNLGELLLAGYDRHTRPLSSGGPCAPEEALDRLNKRRRTSKLPRLKIAAIANDTVATLASLAYAVRSEPNSRVAMGLIVGTGTNATIPMKLSSLHPSKRSQIQLAALWDGKDVDIVVNTEWTINGTAPPLRRLGYITKWDQKLDEASDAPGFQPLEYMTSGRYLGELARLVILDALTTELCVNEYELPHSLRHRNALSTTFLATIVAPSKSADALTPHLAHSLPVPYDSQWEWTPEAASVVRRVAAAVQIRASSLIAAAIVGLLASTGELMLDEAGVDGETAKGDTVRSKCTPQPNIEELVVAYTGGTISRYPNFLETCQQCIDELVRGKSGHANLKKTVVLREALDGGIIGAGVLAGMASMG
ncbi:MAG: hypothetical protein M1829_004906 [Trizodia sp. TS-e1964]|nr:MAG: hypothetical protein M1829_004906 [Trizodia sp. TS-e1964]